MAEYYAFQAALFFSITHIFVRRGLVHSNALTSSLISLGTSAAFYWLCVFLFVPLSGLWTPAVGYFIAGGFFAPAVGQTLGYIGMERIGVARSVPIVNTSPIFSSLFAVTFLGEVWPLQNIAGTGLVILGVIILSLSKPAAGEWNKRDVAFPILGALAFGISTNLRKSGLLMVPVPVLAAAVTLGSAFLFVLGIIYFRGGRAVLVFNRQSNGWLIGAALLNTAAILSFFAALNLGQIVRVEPLVACNPLLTLLFAAIFLRPLEKLSARVILGALITVSGTVLVMTSK
jgi:DME family drug/metabolite transporter